MLRSTASKVMWVGRATVFMVGLAVILALVFGVASAAFGANGQAWILGQNNVATAITKLAGAAGVNGPMLQLINNNADANDTALDLRVQAGEAPMRVNSPTKVTNLNSDQLDGKDRRAFADVSELGGQVVLDSFGPLPLERTYTSNGGTLVIMASGSGYRNGDVSSGKIGMDVRVNGGIRGNANAFAEAENISEVFVGTNIVVKDLPTGTHTIRLEPDYEEECDSAEETSFTYCTRTNSHDNFAVTVLELSD